MPKFFNKDMAELAHQLTLSPRRLRMDQIRGIELLLELVEADRAYPFEFVCYRITSYRKRGATTGPSIPGKALICDLVAMAETISRKANVTAAELEEPFQTHEQVAEALHVSTKTIRRWRNRGLMGIRLVFEDGVSRLAFCKSTVERFVVKNRELVERGAAFRQLTEAERETIITRAGELVADRPLSLHAAARVIAAETGRAVETVRYTLKRNEQSASRPLFAGNGRSALPERYEAIWRCHEAGEANASIARAFETTEAEVEATLRYVQVARWNEGSLEVVHNELFDAPNADALILDAPEPAAGEHAPPKIPKDTPPYLRSLYLTPLLTPGQEQDLFRRYNYLKYKTGKALDQLDPDEPVPQDRFEAIGVAMGQIDELRQRIIRANLRLVVAITKKHVGWSPRFFEVVSDGNMSLMRAVEKFDYARGIKFSTYASWAIMKNYARSIPEAHYRAARYVTGREELLEAAADHRETPVPESDRRQVRELIAEGLETLSDREREVISAHFGLGGQKGGPVTLQQLGERFGVTKERVRQIERRALQRLREVLAPSLVDALGG